MVVVVVVMRRSGAVGAEVAKVAKVGDARDCTVARRRYGSSGTAAGAAETWRRERYEVLCSGGEQRVTLC